MVWLCQYRVRLLSGLSSESSRVIIIDSRQVQVWVNIRAGGFGFWSLLGRFESQMSADFISSLGLHLFLVAD